MPVAANQRARRATVRGWLVAGLRWSFGLLVLAALLAAWQSNHVRRQRSAVAELEKFHPVVKYDYQVFGTSRPPGPRWLRKLFGDDLFAEVASIRILVDGADNETADVLATLPQLRQLVLVAEEMDDQGLMHLAGASRLVDLRFRSGRVTDAGLAHITSLTGLAHLSIAAPQITDAGLISLEDLPNLTFLQLISTDVTQAGIERLRAAMPRCDILVTPEPPQHL